MRLNNIYIGFKDQFANSSSFRFACWFISSILVAPLFTFLHQQFGENPNLGLSILLGLLVWFIYLVVTLAGSMVWSGLVSLNKRGEELKLKTFRVLSSTDELDGMHR